MVYRKTLCHLNCLPPPSTLTLPSDGSGKGLTLPTPLFFTEKQYASSTKNLPPLSANSSLLPIRWWLLAVPMASKNLFFCRNSPRPTLPYPST